MRRAIGSLYGWLYCEVGHWIWFNNTYMLLINMNVYVVLFFVCFIVQSSAHNLSFEGIWVYG